MGALVLRVREMQDAAFMQVLHLRVGTVVS